MITISLCMIVKNEERTLARCLDSVSGIVDEIIIVDTGSSDRTMDVAAQYTDQVYTYEWQDDFAAARNYSFEQATQEYILWLDADDVLLPGDQAKLQALKEQLPSDGETEAVVLNYTLAEGVKASPLVTDRRNRLVKRSAGCRWHGRLHEQLSFPRSGVMTADIAVTHRREASNHSARNVRILRKWIAEEGVAQGRLLFYYAGECYDRKRYGAAVQGYEKLLQEPQGYREDRLIACARLAECYERLGKPSYKLRALLQSFQFDLPHADFCCAIASCFQERQEHMTAIYWYMQALDVGTRDPGFRPVPTACRTWLPHARLSLSYAQLGHWEQALKHNIQALAYVPTDPGLLNNREKLETMVRQATSEPHQD
ncbi:MULTISPECIES: glycosyltransferase family 2 protein [Paenibacillus]|uniref:Glycosyltransferase involved in cell wall biosynthesis n=1 Tax=Paenibacillus amylolyticus TaxID=1451 RepID=A0AAP5H2S6_PAEAM|nr:MULTISPECIES: glycosyltransferase family 2 protein [Paenibacillus]MDR6724225.1 glycosyltransferase involved in cell wall biosynthesis [Paenibacillus amylolyticus]